MTKIVSPPISSVGSLPYMPLDPSWIEQSPAFSHEDASLAKAAMRLLLAAWRGAPCGSIPNSKAYIAQASGVDLVRVDELLQIIAFGFEPREDGRLYHMGIFGLSQKMSERYGSELESFALAHAMASQDPESFSLINLDAASKKAPRGKTLIPRTFGFETCKDDLRGWCSSNGYPTDEDQIYIMERFLDYANGRGDKQKDWGATFRTYARNEIASYKRFPPSMRSEQSRVAAFRESQAAITSEGRKPNPFSSLSHSTGAGAALSKGDVTSLRNLELLQAASARQSVRTTGHSS
jgi:hypothetical protein